MTSPFVECLQITLSVHHLVNQAGESVGFPLYQLLQHSSTAEGAYANHCKTCCCSVNQSGFSIFICFMLSVGIFSEFQQTGGLQ